MNLHPDSPDLSQLSLWRQAFTDLQRQKLDAVFAQLPTAWGPVLSAIPLLFHVNRSRLPGFVSHDTPAGIHGVSPTAADLEQLKKLAGQDVPLSAMTHKTLGGVFLINNPAALSQPGTETLQIRICSQGRLEDFQRQNLMKKCERIQEWAMSQKVPTKLSVHTPDSLFDGCPDQSAAPLSSDAFYTGATLLAGNPPFWWFIPDQTESEAWWQQLLELDDFIPSDYLRLPAPAAEQGTCLADRTLEALEKALTDPYPWLPLLAQLERQLQKYPEHPVLADQMRRALQQEKTHAGTLDADGNRMSLLLNSTDQDAPHPHAELLRRSLYFATGISLTHLTGGQRKRWRVQVLEHLIQQWGWSPADLAWLDSHAEWSPAQVLKERNQIASFILPVLEQLQQRLDPAPADEALETTATPDFPDELLNDGYTELGNEQGIRLSDPARLAPLQNRLMALFDSAPDKIDIINPGIRADMGEDKMTLQRHEEVWRLLQGRWNPDEPQEAIYESDSLVRVLLFVHRNGLLSDYSHLAVVPEHAVNAYELKALINDIKDIPIPIESEQNYRQERAITGWQLFVNVGEKNPSLLSRLGKEKVSDLDDALNFSANRENLIRSLDVFSRTSWGEWQVESLSHESMVHETLMKVLNTRPHGRADWPSLSVHCHSQTRKVIIQQRLSALFTDIMQHFSRPGAAPYLLQTGPYHLLESRQGEIISHNAPGQKQLLKILSQPRRRFRRWQLDPYALQGTALRYVLEHAPAEHWQLWFWRQPGRVMLYIMDDKGSLLTEEHKTHRVKELVQARLSQMNTLNQRLTSTQDAPWPLHLAELIQDPETRAFSHQKRKIPSEAYALPARGLTATVDNERQLTLVSSGQIFRQTELGNQLFQVLVDTLGSDWNDLPGYLRDIRVDHNQQLITHLQYVRRIEHYLAISRQPLPGVPGQPPAPSATLHSSH